MIESTLISIDKCSHLKALLFTVNQSHIAWGQKGVDPVELNRIFRRRVVLWIRRRAKWRGLLKRELGEEEGVLVKEEGQGWVLCYRDLCGYTYQEKH